LTGQDAERQQVKQIARYLKVLTGKIDPEYTKPPVLPKSTATTPKPGEGD
jgi:hypothetical protein